MKAFSVHENLVFHDKNPYAEPLVVNQEGRILRFMLKPGQSVVEHTAPNSPVYIMVIQGTGRFSGGEGREDRFGPGALLVFEPNEPHAIRAEEEPLVFITFLHGASIAQQE